MFVHFGKGVPKHLRLNIERSLKLFPTVPVVLIINKECRYPKIQGLEIFFYVPGLEWRRLDGNLSHPKDFRNNFWLTSLARFLALEKYLEVNSGEIIHVESDVILAPDFPFNNFMSLVKPIAFPILSSTQGIASILYIRDLQTAKTLVSLTMEMSSIDSKTTDMLILRKFYDSYPEITQVVPMGPADNGVYRDNTDHQLFSEIHNAIQIFAGCFDGADIGYFIYGVDPRNDRGRRHIRRSLLSNYLIVPKMNIRFSKERNFLDVGSLNSGNLIPLYSLHIHSKNPSLIRNSNPAMAIQKGASEYLLPQSFKFVPTVFLKFLLIALSRRLKKLLVLPKDY